MTHGISIQVKGRQKTAVISAELDTEWTRNPRLLRANKAPCAHTLIQTLALVLGVCFLIYF